LSCLFPCLVLHSSIKEIRNHSSQCPPRHDCFGRSRAKSATSRNTSTPVEGATTQVTSKRPIQTTTSSCHVTHSFPQDLMWNMWNFSTVCSQSRIPRTRTPQPKIARTNRFRGSERCISRLIFRIRNRIFLVGGTKRFPNLHAKRVSFAAETAELQNKS